MQIDTTSNNQSLEYIIIQAISEKQVTKKIHLALFIIAVIKKNGCVDIELKITKFQKQLTEYVSDLNYHKMLNYRDSIIDENAVDYFGRDFGENDVLKYNIKAETLVSKINLLLIDVFSTAYIKANETTSKKFDFGGKQSFEQYE